VTADFPDVAVDASFLTGASTSTYLELGDPTRGLLGTGTLGPAGGDVWTPIAPYVMRTSTKRGSTRVQSPLIRYEAGTATVDALNNDRRFDPTNLAGPYTSAGTTQVTPMRGIRHRATWQGISYDLWRGYLDAGPVAYQGPRYSGVTFAATDAFKVFTNYNRVAGGSVGAGETSGARINRILTAAGWSAVDRMIATGDSTVQATTLDGDVLSELQLTAESEFGDLYMDGAGRVIFRNRQAVLEDVRSAQPTACFGDVPSTDTTTINLATNPSAEVALTGWSGGGFAHPPTLSLSATHAQFGTQAALATWDTTTSGGDLPQVSYTGYAGLVAGRTYTISMYVYVPTGSPSVALFIDFSWGGNSAGTNDAWVRLTWTGQLSTATPLIQIWPFASTTTAGQQVWFDGVQIEEAASATAYCDGDQAGCTWDGNTGLSSSRRLPELPYADVTLDYDETQLVNLVRISRAGGSTQTVQDATSQALYLTRTYDRSDLLLQTDADVANWAAWLVYQCKDPELRFSQITIKPRRDPNRLWPQVLGRDIGDRIRIIRRPPGGGDPISRDVFIRGIEHQIDLAKRDWTTTWTLQSATKYQFFVLGSNSLGVLGSNALAY
jgi:hypothetical protein